MILHQIKVLQSVAASVLEGGRGVMGTPNPKQPALPIKLYDIEACPYCRRVREVITLLNLDVEIYPCPKKGTRFRPEAVDIAGKAQFPLLVDENTGLKLLESQDIIDHLFEHYGETGKTPKQWQKLSNRPVMGTLVSAVRGLHGMKATKTAQSAAPLHMLELWSFEGSPYSRLVRERLCELELPYVLHTVAKERWQDVGPAKLRLKPWGKYTPIADGKRAREIKVNTKMQVPYLVDPNTGVAMYESADILKYLNHTYG